MLLHTLYMKQHAVGSVMIGTVDNHRNMEITQTVIFVKCRECHDFAKIPYFYVFTRMFC